jgi:hypothetical protein
MNYESYDFYDGLDEFQLIMFINIIKMNYSEDNLSNRKL